jgi:hypothetical protein
MTFKPLLLLLIPLFFASCDNDPRHIDTKNLPTHNKKVFDEGRYCSDYLKFECIPDSHDPKILKGNEPLADGKFAFYDWDEKRFNNLERINNMEDKERKEKMEHYVLTTEDYTWMAKVDLKSWYKEMEATMEEQYPGFWGDTPRTVRHRWMRLCVAKGNKYGYGLQTERVNDKGKVLKFNPENPDERDDYPITRLVLEKNGKPKVIEGAVSEMQQWIELCGRIGLNFDRDPKWKYILDFVKINKDGASAGAAAEYIDFTVYGKDIFYGDPITDWSMQEALSYLPYPNRPLNRQADQREGIDVVRAVE